MNKMKFTKILFLFFCALLIKNSIVFNSVKAIDSENENFMPSSQNVFKTNKKGLFYEKKEIIKDYTFDQSETGENLFRNLIEKIILYLKKLLTPISILLLTWSGVYLFLSRSNEEELKKRKNEVFGIGAGFTIILLSITLVDNVFFGEQGQILQSSCEGGLSGCESDMKLYATNGILEIKGILSFVMSFVIAIAVAFLIFATYTLMFSGEEEEQIEKAKKRILFSIVGIGILISIQDFVNAFLDTNGKLTTPNVSALLGLGGYWSNKILGFIGLISVFALVWAGVQMIINFGDEEKVEEGKKIFKFVIIGLVIAFSLWTIIRFFLTAGAPYNLS